jgi:hypothetical protein
MQGKRVGIFLNFFGLLRLAVQQVTQSFFLGANASAYLLWILLWGFSFMFPFFQEVMD